MYVRQRNTARLIPLFKMHTLGHDFILVPIHAGGLRYHGDAPTLCLLLKEGLIDAVAYNQVEVFDAAKLFVQTGGILPAPEPAHAIKTVIDEAVRCRERGEKKVLAFLLCGHGYFDMKAYEDYLAGKLLPYEYPKEEIEKSLTRLKRLYRGLTSCPSNLI